MIKITLDREDIANASRFYLDDLIFRRKNQDRFTKFDSENDAFLGSLGEIAFKKHLTESGFQDSTDFVRLEERKQDPSFDKYFTEVNGVKHDQCDFLLKLFYNSEGVNKGALRIDVKTQKYVGKYDSNWQFAINEHTVNKIQNQKSKIHLFIFQFAKDGVKECLNQDFSWFNEKQLLEAKDKIHQYITKDRVQIDILGGMKPSKILSNAEKFDTGEIFRINVSNGKTNVFRTQSPMYRFHLKHLDDVGKIIPARNLNFDKRSVKEYAKNLESSFHVKINNGREECLFPYDKVYLNNQFQNMQQMLQKISQKRQRNFTP